ncbi:MAG TPA: hypothetical protein VFZ31_12155, partial [Vicinamibacterales bacterium]
HAPQTSSILKEDFSTMVLTARRFPDLRLQHGHATGYLPGSDGAATFRVTLRDRAPIARGSRRRQRLLIARYRSDPDVVPMLSAAGASPRVARIALERGVAYGVAEKALNAFGIHASMIVFPEIGVCSVRHTVVA